MMINEYNIGYFLTQEHINKGCQLLKKQIDEKAYNFRCIDLEIYRREEKFLDFNSEEFYETYIKKDLLYNYISSFYNYNYSIPKGVYGLRNFNFTSFNLQIVYYSLGFYFLDLIKESYSELASIKLNSNIYTYYGGKLNLDFPEKSKIFYQEDYNSFSSGIKKFIQDHLEKHKIAIIKLDIQNFYHEIKHSSLIESIDKIALPSHKRRLSFDENTKLSIKDLLLFTLGSTKGLLLSQQNIISNFLSDIYLINLDDFILSLHLNNENKFAYYRYVDDFFLLFCRDRSISNESIGDEIFNIGNRISDFILSSLELRCNPLKSQKYILEDNSDYLKFINDAKFISFNDPSFNKDKSKPKEKFDQIIQIISGLKEEHKLKGISSLETGDENALKECFISAVRNYSNSLEAKNELEKVFLDWNPILTLHSIKALMFLIGTNENSLNNIEKFLMNNFSENIKRTELLYLLEKFLLHDKYNGQFNEKITNIDQHPSIYFSMLHRLIKPSKESTQKFTPISNDDLKNYDSLMQQIKKLILSERKEDFTLSFNHLLNMFHIFCYLKDPENKNIQQKKYERPDILKFLRNKLTLIEIQFIISFFDRRNKNPISHAGSEKMENWIIGKDEYEQYKEKTFRLIQKLFPLCS
jgi:hypothetical protein